MKNTLLKSIITASLLVSFNGCDSGSTSTTQDNVTITTVNEGVAVDPYIVGATFFYDANKNGVRDENEQISSETDENGRFTFINSIPQGSRVIMLQKGFHNGIEYEGELQGDLSENSVITPITTFKTKYPGSNLITLLNDSGIVSVTEAEFTKDHMKEENKDIDTIASNIAIDTFMRIDKLSGVEKDPQIIQKIITVVKRALQEGLDEENIKQAVKLAETIVVSTKQNLDTSHIDKLKNDTTFYTNLKSKIDNETNENIRKVKIDYTNDGTVYKYESEILEDRVFSLSNPPRVNNSNQLTLSSKIGDDFTGYAFEWTLLNKPKGSAMSIGVLNELNVTFTPDIVGEYEIQVKVTNTTEETIRSLKFDVLEEIIVSESDVTTLDTDKAFDEDIGLVQDQYWVSSKTLSESQLRALVANFSTITADVYDKTKGLLVNVPIESAVDETQKYLGLKDLKMLELKKGVDNVYQRAYYGSNAFSNSAIYPIDNGSFFDGGSNWHLEKINMPEAWENTTGDSSKVLIGVTDAGFDTLHDDLQNRFATIFTSNVNDHGMAVTGSMAANSNNGIGISGINWQSQVMASYMGFYGVQEVMNAKKDEAEVKVISNSWGYHIDETFDPTDAVQAEDRFSMMQSIFTQARSIMQSNPTKTFVWSAGNGIGNGLGNADGVFGVDAKYENGAMHYKDNAYDEIENLLNVAAFDQQDTLYYYSAYGQSVDIAAPSHYDSLATNNGIYYTFGGTSAAAPVVSGVVSLMYSINPNLTGKEIKDILINTATEYVTQRQTSPYGNIEYLVHPIPIINAQAALNYVKQSVQGSVVTTKTLVDNIDPKLQIQFNSTDASYEIQSVTSVVKSSTVQANYENFTSVGTDTNIVTAPLDPNKRYHEIVSTVTLFNEATNSTTQKEVTTYYSYSDVSIKIVDSKQNLPVTNSTTITVNELGTLKQAQSVTTTQAQVKFYVNQGEYRFTTLSSGYFENVKDVIVPLDQSIQVEVVLTGQTEVSTGGISGYVYDENGLPLQNALIRISAGMYTNGYFASASTNEKGYYELSSISKYASIDFNNEEISFYSLQVTADNYVKLTRSDVIVLEGIDVEENFNLIKENVLPQEAFIQGLNGTFENTTSLTDNGWNKTGLWNIETSQNHQNIFYPMYVNMCLDETEKVTPDAKTGTNQLWFGNANTGAYMLELSNTLYLEGGTSQFVQAGQAVSPTITIPENKEYVLRFDTWWEVESVNPNSTGFDLMEVYIEELDDQGNLLTTSVCDTGSATNPYNIYQEGTTTVVNDTLYNEKVAQFSKISKGFGKWNKELIKSWIQYEYKTKCGFYNTKLAGDLILKLNPALDPVIEGGEENRARYSMTTAGFNKKPIWINEEIDISAYAGKNIRIKFVFNTNDTLYNGFRGWFIDNLNIIDKSYLNY